MHRIINPVSGAEMFSQLKHSVTDCSVVAKTPVILETIQSRPNLGFRFPVSQRIHPFTERIPSVVGFVLLKNVLCVHKPSVAYVLRLRKFWGRERKCPGQPELLSYFTRGGRRVLGRRLLILPRCFASADYHRTPVLIRIYGEKLYNAGIAIINYEQCTYSEANNGREDFEIGNTVSKTYFHG
jgi:hypothetical protein